jgi:hypothetical protein
VTVVIPVPEIEEVLPALPLAADAATTTVMVDPGANPVNVPIPDDPPPPPELDVPEGAVLLAPPPPVTMYEYTVLTVELAGVVNVNVPGVENTLCGPVPKSKFVNDIRYLY